MYDFHIRDPGNRICSYQLRCLKYGTHWLSLDVDQKKHPVLVREYRLMDMQWRGEGALVRQHTGFDVEAWQKSIVKVVGDSCWGYETQL